ncbi:hypothetical protein PRIPAC_72316 [Pristionchus pacificus]|uniref:Uncharacterized protein n=1 Tax=Pristionchus pacificus TaxID=54126 RepID=A0A2A6CSZ8_PRIPA|nr:hypothetical protein PRIPAC_72316 [Pristionchus pacificus]|eukprot:PDM81228.1 hypothetical protein PRIPAC_36231 [Pristionchus pacificus]
MTRPSIVLLIAIAQCVFSQVSRGPCHIQSNNLACTRNGYFEMTQCTSRDCFCVSANNGHIAEETRTGDGKKVPTCSKCHLFLREIFSSGLSLSSTAYVPVCDNKSGEFKPIQCHPARKECWCVETKTGEEIKGSRKSTANNEILQCAPSTGGKGGRFPTALNGKKIEYPVAKETCKKAVDRGQTCSGKKPQVMYYFDTTHADCFAFEYLGCGGNENRYASKKDCHSTCNLMDMFSCSGLVEAKGQCRAGDNFPPPPPPPPGQTAKPTEKPKPDCPEGYRCQMGAFMGFCCNIEVEDFYNKEYNPMCPNGSKPHKDNNGDWDETRLGTNCAHNFCPSNKKCQQGALFAFCC